MSNSKNPKDPKNQENKGTKDTEEKQSKIVTKYDRKVERRKEQKAKEERDKKISRITGIVLAAALVCFVASFPIRTFLTVNGTYITVDGESVSRVEFDYYYNVAISNYLSGQGAWLYYAGIDLSGDLSQQMYSEDMSFKDFFDEMAVDLMAQNKALEKEGRAAGFTYDTAEKYKEYMESLKEYASKEGVSAREYIRGTYGAYATESRVKPYVEEMMYANAYYESVVEDMVISQDEIEQYYNEHKNNYDLIDFRLNSVSAELPKEPTELADPVESAAPAESTAPAEGEGSGTDGAESEYEPSEAEIAAAMEKAKAEAENMEKTIKTEGNQTVGAVYSDVLYILRDWLFAEERNPGDTTVIEDASSNRYYVLAFEKRYRNTAPTVDARVVMTNNGNGQEILDEWKSGEATEASFAELSDKYNDPAVTDAQGGLYEEMQVSYLAAELGDWFGDSSRVKGDTAVISPEGDTYSYVVYYVGANREEWIVNIENTLRSSRASEYADKLAESITVEDKKGNLNYLKVYAKREENAQAEDENSQGENSQGENTPEDTASPEGSGE